ncbi:MAG: mechanosensitive ion channel family protein [Chlamydiae bacterium]|nr:mechanosensitive ion channel family protein [Chlamydiota bacterium]
MDQFQESAIKLANYNFGGLPALLQKYMWAIEFISIILITFAVVYAIRFVYRKVYARLATHKRYWQCAMLQALHRPVIFLIWLLGVTFALDLISTYVQEALYFLSIPLIRKVGVTLLFIWFMIAFIQEIEKVLFLAREKTHHLDKTTIRAITQVLRVIVIVTGVFILIQTTLGVGASAILAFAGGGSFIIGWAAKDMLANIFGGFMIFLDRPFAIGDKICSMDKSIEGYVEHIGWRLTRIRNLDKSPIYIPNAFFSNMSIENPSRMSHRRIYMVFGLRYSDLDKMPKILEEANKMLEKHQDLDPQQVMHMSFFNFGTTSLEILLDTYTKVTDIEDFYRVKQELLFKILGIIDRHGAACAVPVTEGRLTVQLEKSN